MGDLGLVANSQLLHEHADDLVLLQDHGGGVVLVGADQADAASAQVAVLIAVDHLGVVRVGPGLGVIGSVIGEAHHVVSGLSGAAHSLNLDIAGVSVLGVAGDEALAVLLNLLDDEGLLVVGIVL